MTRKTNKKMNLLTCPSQKSLANRLVSEPDVDDFSPNSEIKGVAEGDPRDCKQEATNPVQQTNEAQV